jgi:hypothetical protein
MPACGSHAKLRLRRRREEREDFCLLYFVCCPVVHGHCLKNTKLGKASLRPLSIALGD